MTTAATGPAPREVFSDARGPDRVLRTSWHPDEQLVAFSVWAGRECLATFRLPTAAVPELVGVLVRGLATTGSPASGSPASGSPAGRSPAGDALPRTGALDVTTLHVAAPPTTDRPVRRGATDVLRRASVQALRHCSRGADALRSRLDRDAKP